ncbi:group XIIB secretory phospholipase A2-like protein [Engraulis encrasicolus]|uniref:group XIIB secretory phospholipase A2-like protein n=1 Tax=Engraulis encrasicolus TaxID=184585 RepID=UPI002FD2595C
MYLRLLALLLLCVSSGMSATLRHSRQTVEEAEEEAPALVTEEAPALVTEEAPALVTEEAPALVTEEPPLAPEEESPVAEALVADSHAAVMEEEPSSPEAAAQETLALAAEEPSVEDSPVEEALAGDSPAVDIPPVEEAPVVEEAPPVVAEAEDSHVAVDDDVAAADVDTDTPVETPVDPPQQGANPEDAEPAEEAQAQAEDSDTPAVAAEEAQEEPATGGQAEDTPAGEAAVLTDAPAAEEEEEDTPAAEEEDTPAAVEDTPLAADADAAVDGDSDTEVVAADADAAVADGDGAGAGADAGLGGDLWENLIPEEDGEEDIMAPLPEADDADDGGWGIGSIRSSFQAVNGYFDSLVEMVGGRNGVCQYRCRYGKTPYPRPGFVLPEPNGCSSSLLGFEFDLGIPAMTKCCNQLDECYDTCGSSKNRCDSKFRWCLHGICSELKKSLGFVSKVEVCESMADAMYNTVWTLGCRSYMNSQRAACFCEGEERDEL